MKVYGESGLPPIAFNDGVDDVREANSKLLSYIAQLESFIETQKALIETQNRLITWYEGNLFARLGVLFDELRRKLNAIR